LSPDARGHGTHEQLGLAPCAMMRLTGLPCFLCGMTTSFAWLGHGHPIRALAAQPAAVCLAVGLSLAVALALVGAAAGRLPWVAYPARFAGPAAAGVGAVLTGGWLYKLIATVYSW
jgi:hypothetical protein